MEKFWTPARRAWLYRVSAAAVPLLITLGVLAPDLGGPILQFIAALLGVGAMGLALANVPADEPKDE